MSEIYYSQAASWKNFLTELRQSFRVYVPQKNNGDYLYQEYRDPVNFSFNSYRAVQPVKSFLFYTKEIIAEDIFTRDLNTEEPRPTVVVGLKNCDLHSLKVQDFVFKEGIEVDPLYSQRRENTIFISGDCSGFKEVCFCLALEIYPHPKEGFDLNLSPVSDGYLVEVGSERGRDLVGRYQKFFQPAKQTQIEVRESKRRGLIEELDRHIKEKDIPKRTILQSIVRQGYSSDLWKNFCLSCVECGACNFICCTCHCFLIGDTQIKDRNPRLRVWDSCQYANFARVAGGANPLKRRAQRLRNRFLKKFDFFVDNLGMPACEGCGRCIEACPARIDIREILRELAKVSPIPT